VSRRAVIALLLAGEPAVPLSVKARQEREDVAVGCAMGHGITATAGYRSQQVRRNEEQDAGPEKIHGPVFALGYSF
jgi:hypothetical protein